MCFRLEQNWVGQGSATIKAYGSFTDVHRIKVDEAAGLLITTHQNGGLRVRDIESGDLLWELPSASLPLLCDSEILMTIPELRP